MSSRAGHSVRPKRGGDTFTRTQHPEEPSAKKLRFDQRNPSQLVADADDDEDEAILELDEIGKGAGTKRSAVNLDGFDSDSDNDNFDTRAADRARAQKQAEKQEAEEDEDDMFAELEEEEEEVDGADGADDEDDAGVQKKKKKSVKFLDERDIEGQNYQSKEGSNVFNVKDATGKTADVQDISDDSESGGDEGRDAIGSDEDEQELGAGAKKKHAPRLDAFNMRAEGEEGKFDESGNFVRRADPNAIHDSWLEGVSKKEMKKAREAEQQREIDRRKKAMERDALLSSDLLSTLIKHLQVGESVFEALARLAKGQPKQKPKWQKNKRQNGGSMDVDAEKPAEDPAETKRKAEVETITEAADALLSRGQEEVYDTERELLMRQYKRDTGDDWEDSSGDDGGSEDAGTDEGAQWQFRWADARDGGLTHGPYDVPTMRAWNEAGYFGEGVEFNRVGNGDWILTADFLS